MRFQPLFLLVVLLLLSACAKKEKSNPKIGFYYWKTNFELNNQEKEFLDTLHCQSLYVRIYDVDWDYNNQEAIPKGSQYDVPNFPDGVVPTPVIYVTNRTFQELALSNIDSLAQKMKFFTKSIVQDWPTPPTKIQIDVDWTPSTQKKYFHLLDIIKNDWGYEKVSATIRLHQYKFSKKTGIPPVDEGILMCYNTGKITDWETENSIASLSDINKYIHPAKAYPLPLGVALPIFSWTVIFRDSTFFKIVADGDLSWKSDSIHFKQIAPNRFQVLENTFFKGHYLYDGDLLRYEGLSAEQLNKIAKSISKSNQAYQEILLFQLDSSQLQKYTIFDLEQVFNYWF